MAFIMGDGASYIKAGTEWIAKSVFVLDTFHLEEYINHLNFDEYLKEKLQEAIEQFGVKIDFGHESVEIYRQPKKEKRKLSN